MCGRREQSHYISKCVAGSLMYSRSDRPVSVILVADLAMDHMGPARERLWDKERGTMNNV